jgi:hypothetical protein
MFVFDPVSFERVVADAEGRQPCRRPARDISRECVVGLGVTHRR